MTLEYTTEHLFSFAETMASDPQIVGPTSEGVRMIFSATGGTVSGARVRGEIVPGGTDWVMLRPDGIAILDVRMTFVTHDGALVAFTSHGTADLGVNGYKQFLETGLPPLVRTRLSPQLFTAHPDYAWLNRQHCFGVADVNLRDSTVANDIFSIR